MRIQNIRNGITKKKILKKSIKEIKIIFKPRFDVLLSNKQNENRLTNMINYRF